MASASVLSSSALHWVTPGFGRGVLAGSCHLFFDSLSLSSLLSFEPPQAQASDPSAARAAQRRSPVSAAETRRAGTHTHFTHTQTQSGKD